MQMTHETWEAIDARGLELARWQGRLDVEIGEWMLAARESGVHEHFGFGSFAEYLERRLGYAAHASAERLRVAESLATLEATREALRAGELTWSAAREITRVAVSETEKDWLGATRGRRAGEVQRMVAGRRPGQRPTDRADPRLERHALHYEVGGETLGIWRESIRRLQQELGGNVTEEEVLREMARRVLGGPTDAGRAPFQIAVSRCEDCGRAWQEARGELVAMTPEHAERAACDAQHVGDVGSSHVGRRASQEIPPATRRQVMRRDRGRCRAPGCRNATFLEAHHIALRSENGDHDACGCSPTVGPAPSRKDREASDSGRPIDREVAPIEGEDLAQALALRHADQRRIGEVHGKVPVLADELADAFEVVLVQRQEPWSRPRDHLQERVLGSPGEAEQVHGLGHGGPDGPERLAQPAESLDALLVVVVVAVEERDEGTGVDEDQRPVLALDRVVRRPPDCLSSSKARSFSPVRTERSRAPPRAHPARSATRSKGDPSAGGSPSRSARSARASRTTSDFPRPRLRASRSTSRSVFESSRTVRAIL